MIFFCNDTATTEIYTLSLHDALPIFTTENSFDGRLQQDVDPVGAAECLHPVRHARRNVHHVVRPDLDAVAIEQHDAAARSEEHTSELQSQSNLVCRLLLVKQKAKCIY